MSDQFSSTKWWLLFQKPNSSDLPDPGTHIYVKWEEEDSSDEHGWYHCTVLEYHPDGQVTIRYRDDGEEKIMELVDLRLVDWMPARRNGGKCFPICSYPPTIKSKLSRTPKFTLSAPHKAKAYTDDRSIILNPLKSTQKWSKPSTSYQERLTS